jgi:hypothetical protein
MIKMNSYVYYVDNTEVASYGDMVYIVVRPLDKSSVNLLDENKRKKFY